MRQKYSGILYIPISVGTRALILYYVKTTTIKIANELESPIITLIIALVREQLTIIQQSFTDALAQQ
jgi:hypothetical protein